MTLHSDGISKRSIFGQTEMRWESLERLYYRVTTRSVNVIPIGTYHFVQLIDEAGSRIRFGNRVERPGQLGNRLIELSYPALYAKILHRYNTGDDVDFGDIRLSKAGGIRVRTFSGDYKEIPWDQLSSFGFKSGRFCIGTKETGRTFSSSIHRVPNLPVLQGLLHANSKPSQAS